ncbi:MAG: ABC transporter ATP-binding protein [Promicromonosporaceae bacterium]|nr:ABC transporter ATP-binding protein [Promicromonosporaceae bacterium]
MTPAIEIDGLVKEYGEHRALDRLDLRVEPGSVFGFLGANGAGKTTTLRILLALSRPTSGTARVFGHIPGDAEARGLVGYCPDVPGFFSWMTAQDVMRHAADLFGLPKNIAQARIGELLELTGLAEVKSKVGGYSRGMRQRLGLAQALINAPRLLMLDEPTSALDPLGRRAVLDLLAELRGRTTVFFSTHLLSDVERVCDTVAIIDRGHLVTQGPLADVRAEYGTHDGRLIVEVDDAARLREALSRQPWVVRIADGKVAGTLVLTTTGHDEATACLPALVASLGLRLLRLNPAESTLEDIFVSTVGVAR